jgi:hypothetical protein
MLPMEMLVVRKHLLTLNLPTTTIVAQPFLMFCWPCIIVT